MARAVAHVRLVPGAGVVPQELAWFMLGFICGGILDFGILALWHWAKWR